MKPERISFPGAFTDFYFDGSMKQLGKIVPKKATVLITDEHVYAAHNALFKGWTTIVLKPGEEFKVQETVDAVIEQLIEVQADRNTWIVGVGGGVVTDITGYVASVYMRGLQFGFVPSSLLALVDASIGGKNGIDVGVYKNMVGIIRQPAFILQDLSLLTSLPDAEWSNGFAEIIKHACIRDAKMFHDLKDHDISFYKKNRKELAAIVRRNTLLKATVVKKDQFEKGDRKLLNFGHTLGHALENMYELSHGQAVAIGIVAACRFSEAETGFPQTESVVEMIRAYGLPTGAEFDRQKVFDVLKMDKKRAGAGVNYILLDKIGKGVIRQMPFSRLQQLIKKLEF